MRSRADITHFANVEDEATGTAFEMFRFTTVDGSRLKPTSACGAARKRARA